MSKQLIIAGFHRSGTSMLAQELHNAGLFVGDKLLGPHISNADGHFEDEVFFRLHEKILKAQNKTWQYTSKVSPFVDKVHHIEMQYIIESRNRKHKEWGFKDPRTCLFLSQWQEQLDNPYNVVIYRHYEACVNSLLHRDSRQISDNVSSDLTFWKNPMLGYKMWLSYNQQILRHIEKYPDTTIVVSHESMLNGFPIVETLNEKFGFTLDTSVESAIKDSLLSSQTFSSRPVDKELQKELDETWDKLQSLSMRPSTTLKPLETSIKISHTLEDLKDTLIKLEIKTEKKDFIQSILNQLNDQSIEIKAKIAIVQQNRQLFTQYNAQTPVIKILIQLLQTNEKEVELYFIISELYKREKQYELAEFYLHKLLFVADKIYPYFYNNLANFYLTTNQFLLAEKAIKKAIEGNPNNFHFYLTYSRLEDQKFHHALALEYIDKAIDMLPSGDNNSEINCKLHKINLLYHSTQEEEKAKTLLLELQEKYPDNETVKQRSKEILQEKEEQVFDKEKEKAKTLLKLRENDNYFSQIVTLLESIEDEWAKGDLLSRMVEHLQKLDSDKNMKRVCIIVLGMHRSGTSCLMGSLENFGLFSGDISTWNPHNLKGNREHFSIVALNDKLLEYNNSSWDNPPSDSIVWNDEHKIERDTIIEEFMKIPEQFVGFKDPRTMFTLPFWVEGFNSKMTIKYVGSFRNPSSVIASLQKRNTQMSFENALELWKKYNQRLVSYYNERSFSLISFDKDEDAYKQDIQYIAKILGLKYENAGNNFFYDMSLNNQKTTKNSIEDTEALFIYQRLQQFSFHSFLERREKKLTVLINFYNMKREAKRTLFTLTEAYQGLSSEFYDVIVIDNGSSEPLDEDFVKSFGSNFFYLFFNSKHPSPVEALNYSAKMVKSEYIMCLIDGARMLSPGILQYSFNAWKLSEHPFVYTIGMHLGDEMQNIAMEKGYNQEVEDTLLNTIDWKENGYKLFSISSIAASSKNGFFSMITESNCFSLKRKDFLDIGGFNDKFISPGAGLVNLDFFNIVNNQVEIMPILLLGEATFHQFHGGVATNVPMRDHPFSKMNEEYKSIYGSSYSQKWKKPYYFGTYNDESKKLMNNDKQ